MAQSIEDVSKAKTVRHYHELTQDNLRHVIWIPVCSMAIALPRNASSFANAGAASLEVMDVIAVDGSKAIDQAKCPANEQVMN